MGAKKYDTIKLMGGVLVRVPIESKFMQFNEEHEFRLDDKPVKVPGHWIHGTGINGRVLNRHFYDIEKGDMGKRICAVVEVVEKTVTDGRKFTMLNIIKEPKGTKPECELEFSEKKEGIQIIGTRMFLRFRPIEVNAGRQ